MVTLGIHPVSSYRAQGSLGYDFSPSDTRAICGLISVNEPTGCTQIYAPNLNHRMTPRRLQIQPGCSLAFKLALSWWHRKSRRQRPVVSHGLSLPHVLPHMLFAVLCVFTQAELHGSHDFVLIQRYRGLLGVIALE